MDLRQLQTLLVVAQAGSLKKAAARLRLVETALSRQIRLLEIELNTKLFERHGRGLTPTEAGQHLVDRTRPILVELERGKEEMLTALGRICGMPRVYHTAETHRHGGASPSLSFRQGVRIGHQQEAGLWV